MKKEQHSLINPVPKNCFCYMNQRKLIWKADVVHLNSFIFIPPMAGIENQNISSNPFFGKPMQLVNPNSCSDLMRWVLRWTAYDHEERCSVIFNGEIVFTKPHGEKALVLGYWLSFFFIYIRLVRNSPCKHAYQRFPLVSPYRIPSVYYTSISTPFQQISCIESAMRT